MATRCPASTSTLASPSWRITLILGPYPVPSPPPTARPCPRRVVLVAATRLARGRAGHGTVARHGGRRRRGRGGPAAAGALPRRADRSLRFREVGLGRHQLPRGPGRGLRRSARPGGDEPR